MHANPSPALFKVYLSHGDLLSVISESGSMFVMESGNSILDLTAEEPMEVVARLLILLQLLVPAVDINKESPAIENNHDIRL